MNVDLIFIYSLGDAKDRMRTYCEHLKKPFHARYNPLTRLNNFFLLFLLFFTFFLLFLDFFFSLHLLLVLFGLIEL